MATGTFTLYNSGLLKTVNGGIVADTDNLVMVLLASGYAPDATHSTYADISASEITAADYSPVDITGASLTETNGTVLFDSDDVSFGTNVSLEAKYAVVVKREGASLASTDPLLGYVDLDTSGGTVSSTNSEFVVRTPSGYYEVT